MSNRLVGRTGMHDHAPLRIRPYVHGAATASNLPVAFSVIDKLVALLGNLPGKDVEVDHSVIHHTPVGLLGMLFTAFSNSSGVISGSGGIMSSV